MAKSATTIKKSKASKQKPVIVEEVVPTAESEDDSEDEGVDAAGMEKLLEALGEDGLDEFDQAQLQTLAGGDETDEESEDDDEEVGEVDGAEDSGEGSEEESENEVEDEDIIPLDEIDDELDPDTVPRQRVEIDNKVALARIRDTINLDPSLPWTETLTVSYPETITVDVDDDLNRELAFYKQALHGANLARTLAHKNNLPFTRPPDYFAEMVKSDSHMERIRQRLLDETSSIKKSEDKRKEREGKKYGKQVQIEKLKERERSKKDMDERLKGLKRKRKGALDNAQADDEGFDIAVEDAITERPAKRARGPGGGRGRDSKLPRSARDSKFGFGGAGRRSKQNTRESTDDFDRGGRGGRGGGGGGGRGGAGGRGGKSGFGKGTRTAQSRPGKSKRINSRK